MMRRFSFILCCTVLCSTMATYVCAQDAASQYAQAVDDYNIGNYAKVLRIVQPLAEQGYTDAQILLGRCYENGLGVAQDGAKAVYWFQKAANSGSVVGYTLLGYSYESGMGVAQSMERAVACFSYAAEKGDADAQYRLGVLYNDGQGVAQNFHMAAQWFLRAAEQGNPYAQRYLGAYYANGIGGLGPDAAQAEFWYGKAAQQGITAEGNVFVRERTQPQ